MKNTLFANALAVFGLCLLTLFGIVLALVARQSGQSKQTTVTRQTESHAVYVEIPIDISRIAEPDLTRMSNKQEPNGDYVAIAKSHITNERQDSRAFLEAIQRMRTLNELRAVAPHEMDAANDENVILRVSNPASEFAERMVDVRMNGGDSFDVRSPSGQQPEQLILRNGETLLFTVHPKKVGLLKLLILVKERPPKQPATVLNGQKSFSRVVFNSAGLDAWTVAISVFEHARILGLSDFWLGTLLSSSVLGSVIALLLSVLFRRQTS